MVDSNQEKWGVIQSKSSNFFILFYFILIKQIALSNGTLTL